MKKKSESIKFLLIAGLLLFLFTGTGTAASDVQKIVIFHINDLHAKIEALPAIAWRIQEERKENPDVFFFDAGDRFSGNPIVDFARTPGGPVLEIYNRLGVQAAALGNHDFDYGWKILRLHMERSRFPYLCANMSRPGNRRGKPSPYICFVTASGLSVSVVGLVQTGLSNHKPDTHPGNVAELEFSDPLKTIGEYSFLKEKVDLRIALTHLGVDQDVQLARAAPWLDLIIGGHSHTSINEPFHSGNAMIVQAGSSGRWLGRVEIEFMEGRVTAKKTSLIDVSKISGCDSKIERLVEKYRNDKRFQEVLLDAGLQLEGKDALGSLFCDAVRSELKLDAVFLNNGGIRIGKLPEKILIYDVYRLDPFRNEVVEFSLTTAEIKDLIRISIKMGSGIDLQVSGLCYEVITGSDKEIKEIRIMKEDGTLLEEDAVLRVGVNSYIAAAYRFSHRDPGKSLKRITSDCLIEHLRCKPDISLYRGIVRARVREAWEE